MPLNNFSKKTGINDAVGINERFEPTVNICGDVFVQDNTSNITEAHFVIINNFLELASPTVAGNYFIEVTDGSVVSLGNYISIQLGEYGYQGKILSVDANILYLDTQLDYAYPVEGTRVTEGNGNLNVNGSTTPIKAIFKPSTGVSWDIYSITMSIIDETPMDDFLFGGTWALINGIVLKKEGEDPRLLFNVKSNGDFRLLGDIIYSDKTSSGFYGLSFVKNFQISNGVAIRLNGDKDEYLELTIKDDLTSLYIFEVMAKGHIVVK